MNSTVELERKWLTSIGACVKAGHVLEDLPRSKLYQKYVIRENGNETRIRQSHDLVLDKTSYKLTIKSKGNASRTEVEKELSENEFNALDSTVSNDGRVIMKIRYLIDLNGVTAELDVYQGHLKGLVVVEVEFESEDQMDAFSNPAWFGEEVTNDEHYKNASLATAITTSKSK